MCALPFVPHTNTHIHKIFQHEINFHFPNKYFLENTMLTDDETNLEDYCTLWR